MYQFVLADARFFSWLLRCDHDLARETRQQGCPHCGGRLDQANYPRKPRGMPAPADPHLEVRLSFCCCRDGCRRRVTPPSLRFLGRRVYWAPAVVLAEILRRGGCLGASCRTLRRWRRWWQTTFAASGFWQAARGLLDVPVAACDLPGALLRRFSGSARSRLVGMLRFLAPITQGAAAWDLAQ